MYECHYLPVSMCLIGILRFDKETSTAATATAGWTVLGLRTCNDQAETSGVDGKGQIRRWTPGLTLLDMISIYPRVPPELMTRLLTQGPGVEPSNCIGGGPKETSLLLCITRLQVRSDAQTCLHRSSQQSYLQFDVPPMVSGG
jgi:hypothetical protein